MGNIAQYNGNNGSSLVKNPFATNSVATRNSSNAQADSSQQREIEEVKAAVFMAKQFPRNPIEAMDRILQACTRPGLADGALYQYQRGGSLVTGPSIRLAEVAAQAWGNIQFGIRETEQRNGESTVEAFAWDLETNTRQVKVFQVPHIRHTRKGPQRLVDPRDIYETIANMGSRRLRACILAIIPGDVIEAAVAQCEETLQATADTSPAALKNMLSKFEPFGVTKAMIEKRIQCHLDAIRPAQVLQLRKIYASLRDGMSGVEDWFEIAQPVEAKPDPGKTKTDAIKAKLKATVEPSISPSSEESPELDDMEPKQVIKDFAKQLNMNKKSLGEMIRNHYGQDATLDNLSYQDAVDMVDRIGALVMDN